MRSPIRRHSERRTVSTSGSSGMWGRVRAERVGHGGKLLQAQRLGPPLGIDADGAQYLCGRRMQRPYAVRELFAALVERRAHDGAKPAGIDIDRRPCMWP